MRQWIKEHKLVSIIGASILVVLLLSILSTGSRNSSPGIGRGGSMSISAPSAPMMMDYSGASGGESLSQSKAVTTGRMVIQDSMLSLVVKDVRKAGDQIIAYAKNEGGYMVSSQYNDPDESPFSHITVRVPAERFDATVAHFRSIATKVSSESLVGTDVTDQYQDLDAHLATLQKTKGKFEDILTNAQSIDDILNVQDRIIQLQGQIDSIKGQQKALTDQTNMTKITLYLSSDELSLPYAPDSSFRPGVVFKLAVRSLLHTLQGLAAVLIWIGVYGAIWGPLLLVGIGAVQWKKRRATRNQNLPL